MKSRTPSLIVAPGILEEAAAALEEAGLQVKSRTPPVIAAPGTLEQAATA
ncbi:MAG: hypothetical protein LBB43_07100 [Spirochaetaceae bacterium]|nr:hypothetical protein [Spirochaetaceae bacterium]